MNRVRALRKQLRNIRCGLKQQDGKFLVFPWPREKKQTIAPVICDSLDGVKRVFVTVQEGRRRGAKNN